MYATPKSKIYATGITKKYVQKIIEGSMTYDDVPNLWKKKVEAEFNLELENGDITQEQYDKYMGINQENNDVY